MTTSQSETGGRRLTRLEKHLASARDAQTKRMRQAARAYERSTTRGGARKLVVKRTRQLEKATRRATTLEAKIAEVRGATSGPEVYCLRDRAKVRMRNPRAMTMRNGRAGTTGTCPVCGGRVVRPA